MFEGCLLQTCVSKMYKPTLHIMLQIKLSTCLNETTNYDTKSLADLKTCQTSYVTGIFLLKCSLVFEP